MMEAMVEAMMEAMVEAMVEAKHTCMQGGVQSPKTKRLHYS